MTRSSEDVIIEGAPSVAEVMAAMRAHRAWLAAWHRQVLCRLAPAPEVIGVDAHRTCRFGRWYATVSTTSAAVPGELIELVGTLHQGLHVRARDISLALAAGAVIAAARYDEFSVIAERFARSVLDLERTLRDRVAELDPLTGAQTRRAMLDKLDREHDLVRETGGSSCLAMIDVDHFKTLNDTHGHQAGDAVLCAIARCLRETLRPRDTVFRYGGDEFLVCLAEVELDAAVVALERVRRGLGALDLGAVGVTVSIGVAALDPDEPLRTSIERADRALYETKRAGRDRVTRWGPA